MISQHPDRQASDGLLIQKTSGGSMKKLLFLIFGLMFTQIGMADTVNIDWLVDGQTYTQTTCNVGDSITPPTPPAKYGYTFREWRVYTPIEYLEVTGTQLIRIPALSTVLGLGFHVQFGINFTEISYQDFLTIMAVSVYIDSSKFSIWNSSAGQNSTTKPVLAVGVKYDADYIVRPTGAIININGITTNVNRTFSLSGTLMQIGMTNPNNKPFAKIYYTRLYDVNDNLIVDLIPVLDANDVPCMYDKVSGTFFYNIGTGDFIAGPVVSE